MVYQFPKAKDFSGIFLKGLFFTDFDRVSPASQAQAINSPLGNAKYPS
jgi:hypothetical protein